MDFSAAAVSTTPTANVKGPGRGSTALYPPEVIAANIAIGAPSSLVVTFNRPVNIDDISGFDVYGNDAPAITDVSGGGTKTLTFSLDRDAEGGDDWALQWSSSTTVQTPNAIGLEAGTIAITEEGTTEAWIALLVQARSGGWLDAHGDYLTASVPPAVDSWAVRAGSFGAFNVSDSKPQISSIDVGLAANVPSISFDGSQWIQSSDVEAAWRFFVEPAGFTSFFVGRFTGGSSTQHFIDNANNNITTGDGFNLSVNATNGNASTRLLRGDGDDPVTATLTASMTVNELGILEVQTSEALGYSFRQDRGIPQVGAYAAPGVSAPVDGPPVLGSILVHTVQFLTGDECEWIWLPGGPLRLGTTRMIQEYLAVKYNRTLAPTILDSPAADITSDPRLILP